MALWVANTYNYKTLVPKLSTRSPSLPPDPPPVSPFHFQGFNLHGLQCPKVLLPVMELTAKEALSTL